MGEVYRATDANLARDVAIKVLPEEVAADPGRLARFRREAQLLAALDHPNIAHVYGLEEASGKPFLVLELVEGADLAERLRRGPLPLDEATDVARQIAEALEEAHERGIVHRDLKPANVKLTADGRVKVLDFGLAKALAGDSPLDSAPDLSQSPTLAAHGTQAGVILGTAAYMSPEQARGKPVDRRADIWAFGCVLFELLTGRPLFAGDTVSDTLAAVLRAEPDWSSLPAGTPAAVVALLRRCLTRDPRQRLRDIGDARLELASLADPGRGAPLAPASRIRTRLGLAAAALAVAGEDRGLENFARVDERARQTAHGDGVQAEHAVADREQRDGEHFAVGLAEVLRQERRGLGGDAELRPLGELHAGLADQGDPEAGNAVRPGWVWGRHGVTQEGRAGAVSPPAPAPPFRPRPRPCGTRRGSRPSRS